jgi:tetratricopeptide (TPR) repeat protein
LIREEIKKRVEKLELIAVNFENEGYFQDAADSYVEAANFLIEEKDYFWGAEDFKKAAELYWDSGDTGRSEILFNTAITYYLLDAEYYLKRDGYFWAVRDYKLAVQCYEKWLTMVGRL